MRLKGNRKATFVGVVLAIAAIFLAPFASSQPDGLERVAINHGFEDRAVAGFAYSPFPDYAVGVGSSGYWQTVAAAAVGIAVMLLVVGLLGRLLARKN